jgi:predicted nucleotidyltransferase
MSDINLRTAIKDRYQPFLEVLLEDHKDKIHSVYIVGSALTRDFEPKISDINSVIVLHEMDLKFLELLAPLGKKYGKKRISAPLIMTPAYIDNSRDVFPIEFLNIKLLHHIVFGQDIFKDLDIDRSDLRHQCERELKVKLIGLRQGYISTAGDQKILARGFADSLAGYMPLFKTIIVLLGRETPQNNQEILSVLTDITGVRTDAFKQVLALKKRQTKPTIEKLNIVFEDYYEVIEKLGEIIDALDK